MDKEINKEFDKELFYALLSTGQFDFITKKLSLEEFWKICLFVTLLLHGEQEL